MSDMQKQLDDLRRRVEELERRPIYYPAPVFVPQWPQPYWPTVPPIVWSSDGTGTQPPYKIDGVSGAG